MLLTCGRFVLITKSNPDSHNCTTRHQGYDLDVVCSCAVHWPWMWRAEYLAFAHGLQEPTCSSNSNSKTSRRRRMLKLSMHSTLQPFKRSTAIMGLFLQARQCISPPAYPVPRRGTFSTTGTIQQASSSLNIIHKWHNLHKDIPGSTKVAV